MPRPRRRRPTPRDFETFVVPRWDGIGQAMARRVGSLEDATILEVAAGTGGLTRHLVPALRGSSHLVVSDVSPDLLAVASDALGPTRPALTFVVADVARLPFLERSFDLVVGRFTPLEDDPAAIREARRVLRPGGRLILACWGMESSEQRMLDRVRCRAGLPRNVHLTDTALAARFRAAGLRGIVIETERFDGRYEDVEAYISFCRASGIPPGWSAEVRRRVWASLRAALRERAVDGGSIPASWVVRFVTASRGRS